MSTAGSSTIGDFAHKKIQEIKVMGKDLVEQVKTLIHEGNVRRIVIKDDNGNTYVEIPVSVAAISVVVAPVLAVVGALAAMAAKFTVVVERNEPPAPPPPPAAAD
jgi:hypothetical protein